MKQVIGIDLGGTKIEGVLASEDCRILKRIRIPTEASKAREKVLGNICRVIDSLFNSNVSAIGLSVPGNPHLFRIGDPNIPSLIGFDLAKFLKGKYKCPVIVDNDSNCFALAEHAFGAGKGARNMIGVVIGTGIGSGIIVEGRLYYGFSGGSGEAGHMILDPSGQKCNCGNKGDFESWCAGPYIVKRYEAHGGKKGMTVEQVFRSRDKVAKKTIAETYEKLAAGFANIINILNPDIIVVGGGVSDSLDCAVIERMAKKSVFPSLRKHVRIVKNKLGASSGAIGAARSALF